MRYDINPSLIASFIIQKLHSFNPASILSVACINFEVIEQSEKGYDTIRKPKRLKGPPIE